MLSLVIGALQLFLDRGEQADWFSSAEIWIELGLAISGLWAFVLHITGRENAFIDPQIFRDRNLVMALVMIFIVGMILLAGLALLPPMLQGVMGYPVVTTGIVLAPRGVGTMISMIVVGRLVGKVDTRILIFAGLILTADLAVADDAASRSPWTRCRSSSRASSRVWGSGSSSCRSRRSPSRRSSRDFAPMPPRCSA